jgi:hypothetical protein
MSSTSIKTFDAVNVVRAVRDDLSSAIETMSVEEENRWLRSAAFSDPKLRRLMELAAQQGAAADAASRRR